MTQQATDYPPLPSTSPAASVSSTSIAIWLAIHVAGIVLMVVRARLWIAGGNDADALELILIVQIAGAALFLPALLPDWRTTICIALIGIPFTQLAALIAADTAHVLLGISALTLWVIALCCAMSIARSALGRATIHALAMCVTVGGVVLFYLRSEFLGATASTNPGWFGPVAAAVTLVRAGSSPEETRAAWIQLFALVLAACAIVISKRIFLVASARRAC